MEYGLNLVSIEPVESEIEEKVCINLEFTTKKEVDVEWSVCYIIDIAYKKLKESLLTVPMKHYVVGKHTLILPLEFAYLKKYKREDLNNISVISIEGSNSVCSMRLISQITKSPSNTLVKNIIIHV
jgi:hypothetical protein